LPVRVSSRVRHERTGSPGERRQRWLRFGKTPAALHRREPLSAGG